MTLTQLPRTQPLPLVLSSVVRHDPFRTSFAAGNGRLTVADKGGGTVISNNVFRRFTGD